MLTGNLDACYWTKLDGKVEKKVLISGAHDSEMRKDAIIGGHRRACSFENDRRRSEQATQDGWRAGRAANGKLPACVSGASDADAFPWTADRSKSRLEYGYLLPTGVGNEAGLARTQPRFLDPLLYGRIH